MYFVKYDPDDGASLPTAHADGSWTPGTWNQNKKDFYRVARDEQVFEILAQPGDLYVCHGYDDHESWYLTTVSTYRLLRQVHVSRSSLMQTATAYLYRMKSSLPQIDFTLAKELLQQANDYDQRSLSWNSYRQARDKVALIAEDKSPVIERAFGAFKLIGERAERGTPEAQERTGYNDCAVYRAIMAGLEMARTVVAELLMLDSHMSYRGTLQAELAFQYNLWRLHHLIE